MEKDLEAASLHEAGSEVGALKIYTKTGDDGTTGLVGGARVAKSDLRIEAIGEVDELNACLGFCRTATLPQDLDAMIECAQSRLFDLGAELATPPDSKFDNSTLGQSEVEALEADMDRLTAELPPLRNFILPGGVEAAGRLQIARAACRRAERRVIGLAENAPIRDVAIAYLNRLSDWLFVAARTVNAREHVEDVKWKGKGERQR